jgi:D-serine deaminase-like pyridoxal phosphate-dependent protein
MQAPPARPGDAVGDIDTPALVVDLDAFERNLDLMANAARGAGVALRPHGKAHKCPEIAQAQLERGAVGICCQKVGEAEAFVAAGIRDVLVTNEIIGGAKLARLAAMAKTATVAVLVDDVAAIPGIGVAARAAGVNIAVLVEINVGANRCGVAPGAPAVAVAQAIVRTPGLSLRGIHAYHGAAQHLRTPEERRAAIARAVSLAHETKAAIEAAGIPCPTVTGAGTGTWQHERDSGVYTELQPGSYVFMDADYQKNALAPDQHHFEQSLFVVAAVMSAPVRERAIVDAGLKAFAFDSGPPLVYGAHGWAYVKASDEHGVIAVEPDAPPPRLGDRLWLVPGHCDPTVNLYDWIVGVRGARVECLWPVAARGALG